MSSSCSTNFVFVHTIKKLYLLVALLLQGWALHGFHLLRSQYICTTILSSSQGY